jgi:diguanylate cyclase (GGDEF)-like protein/PAS domain S-box-containing protein
VYYTWYGILKLFAGIISGFTAVYVWRRKTSPETFWFALLMGSVAVWALADFFEAGSVVRDHKILFSKISYAGVVSIAPLWFLFSFLRGKGGPQGAALAESGRLCVGPLPALIWLVPMVVLVAVWTNERHGLVWSSVVSVPETGGLIVRYFRGPLFWFNALYSYALILAGSVRLAVSYYRSGELISIQGFLVSAAVLFPWVVNLLYLLGLTPRYLDFTSAAFAVSGSAFFWAILRLRILNIAPFARDMLFRDMTDGVVVVDSRCRLSDINPAAEGFLGLSTAGYGSDIDGLLKEWPGLADHCKVSGAETAPESFEISREGMWFDVRISTLRSRRGRIRGKLLVLRDITARKQLEEELVQYATIDILTGAFNRRMGLSILDQQLRYAERNGTYLTICFADINDLKMVNDNYGHAEGDFLIKTSAAILRETLRDSDILCRLGGDEFLVILPDCPLSQARAVWSRVEERLGEVQEQWAKPFPCRLARGFAEYTPGSGRTCDELMSLADEAMYRNKERIKGLLSDDTGK